MPHILIASADYRTTDRHLRELGREVDAIQLALQLAQAAGLCTIEIIAEATVEKLVRAFERKPVAGFHFAGHANGYKLMLRDGENASKIGLAQFLGQQPALQFVFLNACATQQHARALNDAGVPAVIATARPINDKTARELATTFYTRMGEGAGLTAAFDAYQKRKQLQGAELRSLYWEDMDEAFIEDWPWALHLRPGSEALRNWNLPQAAGDPLFGLPPLPQQDLPEAPFRYLRWFGRKHAEVFFGRSHQIRELYDRITRPDSAPILMFHGGAGVGKSSLLHAGLLPRLEAAFETLYLRRNDAGLLPTLRASLGDGATVANLWRAREKTGKPLLVVLDQAEEVFLAENGTSELKEFLDQLVPLFLLPENRPQGMLILSFRKEFLPEWDRALGERRLYRNRFFLEPLGRDDIIQAITGITRQARTQDHYGIQIAEQLPARIADDLLEDRESAIAPMLQILLTRLWEEGKARDYSQPVFSHDIYLILRREGLLLSDFLDRQLTSLAGEFPNLVDSGLALDLAFRLTNTLGAAQRIEARDLRDRYAHVDKLDPLLRSMENLFLLRRSDTGYTLAHDTLAPVVRQRYELSTRPGQQADRILRLRTSHVSLETQLSSVELEIVERGIGGRQKLSKREHELLDRSQKAHTVRKLREFAERNVLEAERTVDSDPSRSFGLAAEAWRSFPYPDALRALHRAYYRKLIHRRGRLFATPYYTELFSHLDYVDTVAWHPAGRYGVSGGRDGSLRLFETLGETGYREIRPGGGGRVHCARFSPDGEFLATSCEKDGNTVRIWRFSPEAAIWAEEVAVLSGHEGLVKDIAWSPDGRHLVTGSWDTRLGVWTQSGKLMRWYEGHKDRVNAVVWVEAEGFISRKTQFLLSAGNEGTVYRWSLYGLDIFPEQPSGPLFANRLRASEAKRQEMESNARKPLVFKAITGDLYGAYDQLPEDPDPKNSHYLGPMHTNFITALAYRPFFRSGYILCGAWDGLAQMAEFSPTNSFNNPPNSYSESEQRLYAHLAEHKLHLVARAEYFRQHTDRIQALTYLASGEDFATASWDGTIGWYHFEGSDNSKTISPNFLGLLRGHTSGVHCLAFSPDGKYLLSGSSDRRVLLWSLEARALPQRQEAPPAKRSSSGRTRREIRELKVIFPNDPNDYAVWRMGEIEIHRNQDLKPVRITAQIGGKISPYLDVSPDGAYIVAPDGNRSCRVVTAAGDEVAQFNTPTDCYGAQFTPDGNYLETLDEEGTVTSWPFSPEALGV